jgi:hypothetical protein
MTCPSSKRDLLATGQMGVRSGEESAELLFQQASTGDPAGLSLTDYIAWVNASRPMTDAAAVNVWVDYFQRCVKTGRRSLLTPGYQLCSC